MMRDLYHHRFDYSPIIDRPPLRWPDSAHVAVWIVPNIEHYRLESAKGGIDVRGISPTEYGNRVGIWRLMEVMDRHTVRGTVALNAAVCELYPRIIEEVRKRDWELMGHGISGGFLTDLSVDAERETIHETLRIIEQADGQKPRGWLGPGLHETPQTLDLLREAGIEYVCDWVNDDQPYRMNNGIYSIPYTVELNDRPVFMTAQYTPAQFCELICEAFDVLYREGEEQGRVMCIALHPFLIGTPTRIGALDRALSHIRSHPKVWFATGAEIIDWYRSNT